jgi:hypothetical protein
MSIPMGPFRARFLCGAEVAAAVVMSTDEALSSFSMVIGIYG